MDMTYVGVGQDERTKAGNTSFTTGFLGLAIADTWVLGDQDLLHPGQLR